MSVAHVGAQLAAYASLLVLARLLPPGSFGTVAAGTAIIYIAIQLMDAGTAGSIILHPELTPRFLRRVFLRCLGLGIGLAVILAVGAQAFVDVFAKQGDPAVLAALAVGVPVYALAVVPMAILQRSMEFRDLARAWAASNVGAALLAVGAGLLGAGVWALVVRQLAWFALLAMLMSFFARGRFPRPRERGPEPSAPPVARWFLVFCVTQVLALNLDYLVVGRLYEVTAVGLYALAFMIAFAPVDHFSAQVGKVLFAAAAASGVGASGSRTVAATRLMAVLLLPVVPVAVTLAPPLLPAILGEKWSGAVAPFQLLVIAGVGYAITNCVGEAMSGAGQMAFRAKVNCAWCLATVIVMIALVHADGIRGAALAHLVVFAGYAIVYGTAGARRIGTTGRALWAGLQPMVVAVAVQAGVTAAAVAALHTLGASRGLAAGVAVVAGLGALGAVGTRGRAAPLREAVTVFRAAASGAGSSY